MFNCAVPQMNIEKSYLTLYPNFFFWPMQKMGVLILYFLPLPTYANDDDTLLQFSMQVGSIVYTLIIVFLLVRNAKVRIVLSAVYLSLTVSTYLFTLNPVFELNLFLTVFICSIFPLLFTIVLAISIRMWRKT
jgi:hypothetical protein